MKNTVSIKENHLFQRLYRKGSSAVTPCIALYAKRNGRRDNRLGLTVSTKVGHAVVRNRVRRRLREVYRAHEPRLKTGMDLVVVARVRAGYSGYRQLDAAFQSLCTRLDLWKKEDGA